MLGNHPQSGPWLIVVSVLFFYMQCQTKDLTQHLGIILPALVVVVFFSYFCGMVVSVMCMYFCKIINIRVMAAVLAVGVFLTRTPKTS